MRFLARVPQPQPPSAYRAQDFTDPTPIPNRWHARTNHDPLDPTPPRELRVGDLGVLGSNILITRFQQLTTLMAR